MSQILDGGDASGTSGADNNVGADVGNKSATRDNGSTGGTDNNSDGQNTYAKASFSTDNVAVTNTNTDIDNTIGMGEPGSIGGADNNTDNKNTYVKAGFSIYNIAGSDADAGACAGNTNDMGEKVSNNTNNTGED